MVMFLLNVHYFHNIVILWVIQDIGTHFIALCFQVNYFKRCVQIELCFPTGQSYYYTPLCYLPKFFFFIIFEFIF